ncbi:hypothetical protein, partial [Escherichia coli]|uniref:hypothetical protein n=1 Tax=Escherichia coli TaxID=562 RepID=UPI001A90A0CE
MAGSNWKDNSEEYISRIIKLEELKSYLSDSVYNDLKKLLNSLKFNEFDVLFDVYSKYFSF